VRRRLHVLVAGIAGVLGCRSAEPLAGSEDSAASATSNRALASEAGAPAPTGKASSTETWAGAYVSEAGSIYVVDGGEWAGVKWRGDDASVGLGNGTMSLSLNRSTGEVRGTGEGPLGDVVFAGAIVSDAILLTVSRKDPLDRGLTGTAVATMSGDRIAGKMRLAVADARVIRQATLTLSRGGNP
jgi:hypothetical protein